MNADYAVVAFPALERADSIEAVRRRFDPLADLLAAHVTVVFPFATDLVEATLADHVRRTVRGVAPFTITLTDVSREAGGYLFLNVGAGAERFRELHGGLYSGPWAHHRSSAHEYRPHVTVGRVTDHAALPAAHREAHLAIRFPIRGTVPGLAIVRLDAPDRGAVIDRIAFADSTR